MSLPGRPMIPMTWCSSGLYPAGVSDALNLRYPTLYENGADIATLELEITNDGANQPNWRLYRVSELDLDRR
jgi:hypothetical protein